MTAEHPTEPPDSVTRVDGMLVEEVLPPPEDFLRRLRTDFPNWGILLLPSGMWLAVRGAKETGFTIQHPDPLALRNELEVLPRWQR